ncbi:MAG TPA: cation-transporting P-type ATPase [Segeticoccus sp.]|uniref:cation-translocating P-type ATPase n=1 Tax=Segeticoccus sp. TaxID=2706531 RepID=UPI002D7E4914|nr:cation-transporting P-type ATPase [Segeticoccus sp.]HET8600978.1 cation-transporting P-type ATPase [Segeticoccus sp.]
MSVNGPVASATTSRCADDRDELGLTNAEAAARLAADGPNQPPATPPVALWQRVVASARDPLVLLLLFAVALTIVTRDWTDAMVIGAVIVINTTLAVRQEITADAAVRALAALTTPLARVRRDGSEQSLPADQLVPGDLILLAEGDLVPADCRLLQAAALRADESLLTGESAPVDKAAADGPDREGELFAGTVVVHGRGSALVTATGPRSTLGRIATMVQRRRTPTPLERRLRGLSATLAVAALGLCAGVLVLGLLRGEPLELMVLTAISLAVAAVPESLPAVVTITLALAARRMAKAHAAVRVLSAAEALGAVTLLATDKTGTLTEGRMRVGQHWSPASTDPTLLWEAVVLCNDAAIHGDGQEIGDPMEVALLRGAAAAGVDVAVLRSRWRRYDELPFDSIRKRMTTAHVDGAGQRLDICKGAPEQVLTPELLTEPPSLIADARRQADEMAAAGARVLAVAQKAHAPAGLEERGLRLLGLVGLLDPARSNARDTLDTCRGAGIDIALVTGDHPATAAAIGKAVGLVGPPVDLGPWSEDVDERGLLAARVISRTTPEDKLRLVRGWQAQGHVVAMTGDGVNDAPALRQADIGVAMGGRGTEVARQAADLVLLDDDLATLVVAVREGRRAYANLRRFLAYGLSGGASEILVMVAGPLLGLGLPLLPVQILWINLLTHSFAGTALGLEPADPGVLDRGPRSPKEAVLGGGLWWRTSLLAVLIALVTLGAARVVDAPLTQSMVLFTLGAAQLGVGWGVRARGGRRRTRQRLTLPLSLGAAGFLLLAPALFHPLQLLLTAQAVSPVGWGLVAGAFALTAIVSGRLRPQVW